MVKETSRASSIAELYRRKITALQDLLRDGETRVEAMQTIRDVVGRIEDRAGALGRDGSRL